MLALQKLCVNNKRTSTLNTVCCCPGIKTGVLHTIWSSFILRTTYPQSSVTPPLAGPSGRRPPGMWRSPSRLPAVVVDLAGGRPHTRHGAGGGNLQKPVSATRAASTLAYSNPSPSSHGSEMVRTDRRGLILTNPNQIPYDKTGDNHVQGLRRWRADRWAVSSGQGPQIHFTTFSYTLFSMRHVMPNRSMGPM